MINRRGDFRELVIVIKLQIGMHFFNRLVNLPQLCRVHIFTHATTTESDSFVFNPPAKVDSHLQLSLFVTREPQRLIHPTNDFPQSLFVDSTRGIQIRINLITQLVSVTNFIVSLHQQVSQQFLALNFELCQQYTNIEQVIVVKLSKLFFQFADFGGFPDVSLNKRMPPGRSNG